MRTIQLVLGLLLGATLCTATLSEAKEAGPADVFADHVQRTISKYLDDQLEGRINEVHVHMLTSPPALRLPSGKVELRVVSPQGLGDAAGRQSFRVMVTVDRQPVRTFDIVADVTLITDVVVAARLLKADEIIAQDDVSVVRVVLDSVDHDFVTDTHSAIGRRVAKTVRPHAPVRVSALAPPYVVNKGDRVTIEARHGGLVIQASGVIKGSAEIGQTVVVTNQDSGRDIRAKVSAPGIVRVEY